jgi:hypothetical protein
MRRFDDRLIRDHRPATGVAGLCLRVCGLQPQLDVPALHDADDPLRR